MAEKKHRKRTITRTLVSLLVLAFVVVAFAVGYYLARSQHQRVPPVRKPAGTASVAPSKHRPDERSKEVGAERAPLHSRSLEHTIEHTMSEAAKTLAEVETAEVKRERAWGDLRMVGMVFEDETRIAALTSRVDGRLDAVYVDFTGVKVEKGDPMVKIWSRTLITSQVELFETIRSPEYGESVIKGAEEKLKQLGLTQNQIDKIRRQKKPDLYITLRAPISGIVMKKNALLGHFVKEGTVMYEITDLSKVWVKLDAYETDLPWIRYGQKVTFTTPAIPGKTFKGKIIFIDPMLHMTTRTVKVRVEVDNPELLLKPMMFVRGQVEAEVDYLGRVIKSEWAGKYICPVHPDEVSSEPGICPRSKQARRPPEAYGYTPDRNPTLPLVIPATAVLYTGKRSLVYVEGPNRGMRTYEPREVVLGPRARDKYVVYEGLKEGERVVTKGNFEIDSASQILAKSSMMNPAKVKPSGDLSSRLQEALRQESIEAPREFGKVLSPVFSAYWVLKDALVKGRAEDASNYAEKMAARLRELDLAPLTPRARDFWNGLSRGMMGSLEKIGQSKNLTSQRKAFRGVSDAAATAASELWRVLQTPLYVYHCPTAFGNEGAYWIEGSPDFANPYLGQEKPACGKLVAKLPPENEGHQATMPDKGQGSPSIEVKHSENGSSASHKDQVALPPSPKEERSHKSHSKDQ